MNALEWGFPLALWLILPGWLLLAGLGRDSATGLSVSRARMAFLLRGLVLTLLLGALAEPKFSMPATTRHIVWAVDSSQSVGQEGWRNAKGFIEKTRLPRSQQTLLGFAEKVVPMKTFLGEEPPGVGPERTNLARAAQCAVANFPPGRQRLLALITDGRENEGDLKSILPTLKDAGVAVVSIPVEPLNAPNALITGMRLPTEARAGEPFPVEIAVASTLTGPATLEIRHDGLLAATLPATLQNGENRISITQRLSNPGLVTLSATIRAPGDLHPEDDTLTQPLQILGPPRILIVNDSGESRLADALRSQGILTEIRPGRGAPGNARDFTAFDVIVLEDAPAAELDARQVQALISAVKDFGAGLLMLGGPHSFGPGGYAGTPLEEILPVHSELKQQREEPSVALALVLDRSGSMTGEKMRMATTAAISAAGQLSDQDLVGVVTFDNEARWAVDLQSAANASAIASKLAGLTSGGGTRISAGLELAWEGLRRAPARIRHVILLSDGVSSPGPFAEIAARLSADRITLSAVGVGPDADAQLLEQLARWGRGRYYHAATAETLPQIFVRETLLAVQPALRELPVTAIPSRADGPLAGIAMSRAPALLGYVSVLPKPGATLWLATDTGEPLLASWRVGLGSAAAFTSDAGDLWAADWIAWDEFGKFWAQVLRGLMRPADLRNFPMTVLREREGFRVSVDVSGDAPLRDLGGRLVASGPGGILRSAVLEKDAPAHLTAWIPAREEGPWLLQATVTSQGESISTLSRGMSVGARVERIPGPANYELLEEAARQTGGLVHPAPGDLTTLPLPPQSARNDLWPMLLLLALGAFLGDVAVRRMPGRIRRIPPREA